MQGFDPVNMPAGNDEEPKFQNMWWLKLKYKRDEDVPEAFQEKQLFPDVMLRLMLLQEILLHFKDRDLWHMKDFVLDYEPVDDFDETLLYPIPKLD